MPMSSDDRLEQQQQHHPKDRKRNIRGPRSKRNRKRACPEPTINYNVCIRSLTLNDKHIQPVTYCRSIEPYPFTFATYAKARWIGRTVLDVYCTEFGSYPKSYYEAAILQGRIQVSGHAVPLDYKIRGNDVLSHTVHRHEPAVLVSRNEEPPISIIAETDDLLVVDKPATLPVHPCGAYQQNSLLPILEPSFGKLHIIHRLDRLTSGLVLLAKTSKVAQIWGKALMEREACQKVYLARVKGKFPLHCPSNLLRHGMNARDGPVQNGLYTSTQHSNTITATENASIPVNPRHSNALTYWLTNKDSGEMNATSSINQVFSNALTVEEWLSISKLESQSPNKSALWFHLACPTRISDHKNGICHCGSFDDLSDDLYLKSVKPAQTSFGVVRYDASTDTTILVCRPQTGRTHQIRLHLQYLGHPIANDPCYGGELWFDNAEGQLACEQAGTILESLNVAAAATTAASTSADGDDDNSRACHTNPGERAIVEVATIADTPATEAEISSMANLFRDHGESLEDFCKKTCVWCARSGGTDRSMLELLVRSRGIWLHALKYSLKDTTKGSDSVLEYETDLPVWS